MKSILCVVVTLLFVSAGFGSDTSQSPLFYWYGTVSKSDIETLRKTIASEDVVVAQENSQRRFWKPWIVDTTPLFQERCRVI